MEITKKDREQIVKNATEVLAGAERSIPQLQKALRDQKVNAAISKALIKKFK